MTQKTGGASQTEFTGLSFSNDFNKSSSQKPLGLNWNTPWLEQGKGVTFGGMLEQRLGEWGGVGKEGNWLMIGWGQTVHQCLSSFRLAEKCHRVPGRRVIYLPDLRERGQQEDTLSQRISPCSKRSSFVGAGRLDHWFFPIFRYSCILHTLKQGFRKESRLILTHLKDWFLMKIIRVVITTIRWTWPFGFPTHSSPSLILYAKSNVLTHNLPVKFPTPPPTPHSLPQTCCVSVSQSQLMGYWHNLLFSLPISRVTPPFVPFAPQILWVKILAAPTTRQVIFDKKLGLISIVWNQNFNSTTS